MSDRYIDRIRNTQSYLRR